MSQRVFEGNFTQQEPIPEDAIARAVAVMRSGRLHRYNTAPGEASETALLEQEYARYQGARYCLACASGGYALYLALMAFGLQPGEPVLTNAFTLSPVPGAIDNAGGVPLLVESSVDLVIDLADLADKIEASGARLLLLSHMRGHLVDMQALMRLLDARGVALIEDCAHTMGAEWNGVKSGNFGVAACFSTQTYKHINSGEGGFITSDDAKLMARATVRSGSYMLYESHLAGPPAEAFAEARYQQPNQSGRMDNLRAAILRPQLAQLDESIARWNQRYRVLEAALADADGLLLRQRPAEEHYVASSIQFLADDLDEAATADFLTRCNRRGVALKWFGADDPVAYTSRHDHWGYVATQSLPKTDALLKSLFDMRVPLTFSLDDCQLIGEIIVESLAETRSGDRLEGPLDVSAV